MKKIYKNLIILIIIIGLFYAFAILYIYLNPKTLWPIQPEGLALCSDSDNGKNIFIKGTAATRAKKHLKNAGEVIHMGLDSCSEKLDGLYSNLEPRYLEGLDSCAGDNCYVKEVFCSENIDSREFIKCPNGCNDGACIK
jgi:hypothetical protein